MAKHIWYDPAIEGGDEGAMVILDEEHRVESVISLTDFNDMISLGRARWEKVVRVLWWRYWFKYDETWEWIDSFSERLNKTKQSEGLIKLDYDNWEVDWVNDAEAVNFDPYEYMRKVNEPFTQRQEKEDRVVLLLWVVLLIIGLLRVMNYVGKF